MIRHAIAMATTCTLAVALTAMPATGQPSTSGASQQAELLPSDPNTFPFGSAVAIDGTTAVVGVPGGIEGDQAGVAYVFVMFGDEWSQEAELTLGGSDDQFGYSVAISGDTLVVGAPLSANFAGAAYVFVRSNGVWSQQAELLASDAAVNDFFGGSVAIFGSTLVVGAPGHASTGAAYVFAQSNGHWTQKAELTASDGDPGDSFGASVAINGDTAVVGAPRRSAIDIGAAYVFGRLPSGWSQRAELTPSDPVASEFFGTSVSVLLSTVLVGAPAGGGHESPPGKAFVFVRANGMWSPQAVLVPSDSAAEDEFGISVALLGSTALVGSPFGGRNHMGEVDVFIQSGTSWPQAGKLLSTPRVHEGELGYSVAISGITLVAGAPDCCPANTNRGAVFVFLIG